MNASLTPKLLSGDIKVGDRYLICSDGLCGMVTDAAIGEVIGGERLGRRREGSDRRGGCNGHRHEQSEGCGPP